MKRTLNGRFFRFLLMLSWMLLAVVSSTSAAHQPSAPKTKWVNGKKYLLHKVAKKETWSSLSRTYHMSIADLQKANPGVAVLKISQIIQIPTEKGGPHEAAETKPSNEAKSTTTPSPKKSTTVAKTHTVAKGETLYHIATANHVTVAELKKLNNLKSNAVAVGQKLKLGAVSGGEVMPAVEVVVKPVVKPMETSPEKAAVKTTVKESEGDISGEKEVVNQVKEADEKAPVPRPVFVKPTTTKEDTVKPAKSETPSIYSSPGTSRSVFTEKDLKSGASVDKIVETGVATWVVDGELNQNKFYALHRTAPVGTIIKVTNRMNNNSVYLKVVGMLPDTGDNANVIIKITQAAAQRIGALDQKFTAELSYGITK